MLEHALAYARMQMPVFRLSSAKVPLKNTHGHLDATLDEAVIRQWWDVPSPPNIGFACGDIFVLDFDGADATTSPWGSAIMRAAQAAGGMPDTAVVFTRRGVHFYFRSPAGVTIRTKNERRAEKGAPGVDIKAHGGYVVCPPSVSKGFTYHWRDATPIAEAPQWLLQCIESLGAVDRRAVPNISVPAHLQGRKGLVGDRARIRQPATTVDLDRIESALRALPADAYDTWYQVGLALHSTGWEAGDGTSLAFDLFDRWSQSCPDKYSAAAVEDKWRSFDQTSRGDVTLGTLFHLAKQAGWIEPRTETIPQEMRAFSTGSPAATLPEQVTAQPYTNGHALGQPGMNPAPLVFKPRDSDNPLIELNEKYSVIGDVGGKCLVLGWTPSKFDKSLKVPSFQTFKSFSERYGSRYITVTTEKANGPIEEAKQLGTYWLKWTGRKSYEAIDLVPNAEPILEGNVLNLWSGFSVPAVAGSWQRMAEHIVEVLADGDHDSAAYIMRFAAWAIQNPGERAEAALVFRGEKGSGKGTFAGALRSIFGQHGLQIFSPKHLVGTFNAHLRNCLLLFADEAFWAGDKQGESTLKGLITEPSLMIEQKGVDATPWTNRLKVIMAANADWVVPAGAAERRYAVFNVSSKRVDDHAYFERVRAEMAAGGLSAMLHALSNLDLKGWHPRLIVKTAALREQKAQSMSPLQEWFENVLQEGRVPGAGQAVDRSPASALLRQAQEEVPKMRDVSAAALGRFLRSKGCVKQHDVHGSVWQFPRLAEARSQWAREFGGWTWIEDIADWRGRRV